MSSNQPDDFDSIAVGNEALQPKKTLKLPLATAILAGVVVLAAGGAAGAGLHAALGSDETAPAASQQGPRGNGFRGQGQGGGQNATVGTVVSATSSELVVKTAAGDVTVKLTGETAFEITEKGKATDLKTGEQVVVSGTPGDGGLTATTVRQGGTTLMRPGATPTPR